MQLILKEFNLEQISPLKPTAPEKISSDIVMTSQNQFAFADNYDHLMQKNRIQKIKNFIKMKQPLPNKIQNGDQDLLGIQPKIQQEDFDFSESYSDEDEDEGPEHDKKMKAPAVNVDEEEQERKDTTMVLDEWDSSDGDNQQHIDVIAEQEVLLDSMRIQSASHAKCILDMSFAKFNWNDDWREFHRPNIQKHFETERQNERNI